MRQREAVEAVKRQHELELGDIIEQAGLNPVGQVPNKEDWAKTPKLPSFVDGKYDLDTYLQRFERFATYAKWEKTGWTMECLGYLFAFVRGSCHEQ